MLLCFTIFSIFWEEIRVIILSLFLFYVVSSVIIAVGVTSELAFLSAPVRIFALRSTISLCLSEILSAIEAALWALFNFEDQILCSTNFSRVLRIY